MDCNLYTMQLCIVEKSLKNLIVVCPSSLKKSLIYLLPGTLTAISFNNKKLFVKYLSSKFLTKIQQNHRDSVPLRTVPTNTEVFLCGL